MRASKFSAATRRRRNALLEQRNRGLALTYEKRCQKDMATHRRHLSQYLTKARRRGWINPKDLKDL